MVDSSDYSIGFLKHIATVSVIPEEMRAKLSVAADDLTLARDALSQAQDEITCLEKQDEIHWKTRRGHLRTIDAWKRINKDARNKLRAFVCGYFNDTGAEPSVSVLGRAANEAKDFLQATRSDSPQYKRSVSTGDTDENKQE